MIRARAILLTILVLGSACTTRPSDLEGARPTVTLEPPESAESWREVARSADRDRLARLDVAWQAALDGARAGRMGAAIAREGALLDPAAALPRAAPPPGPYRCRLLRMGGDRGRAFTAYRYFFCHVGVEDALLSLTKQTGSDRPGGYVWADRDDRLIFLGAMARGQDEGPPAYGDDPERDMVGLVQRFAPFRYRVVFPWPRPDVALDVMELVPLVDPVD